MSRSIGFFGFNKEETAPSVNFLLDNSYATGSVVAFSVRKLSSSYSGSALRVRRASDNAEQDIGFTTSGDLDETALTNFCSGTNGFVKTWYNQGSGNNAIATSTTREPKIYDSSNGIEKLNGKPCLVFDGSNDCFQVSTFSTPALFTHIIAGSSSSYFSEHGDSGGDKFYCYSLGGSFVNAVRTQKLEDGGAQSFTGTGNKIITWMINGLTASLPQGTFGTGGSCRIWENATERAMTYRGPANERILDNNNVVTKTLNIGSRNQTGIFANGRFHELLHFEVNKDDTSVSDIQTNINDYYSIY